MYKTELDELIEYYQQEIRWLKKALNTCLDEQDYVPAHYYQSAIHLSNRRLRLLHKLKDPYYDEIEGLERSIRMYKGVQRQIPGTDYSAYVDSLLEKYQKKIDAIASSPREVRHDAQEIDEALFKMVEHSISGFKLFFGREEEFCLDFRLSAEADFIEIIAAENNARSEDGRYAHVNRDSFLAVGFTPDNTGSLLYRYNIARFRDANEIKTMLARLLFEGFYILDLNSKGKLLYY